PRPTPQRRRDVTWVSGVGTDGAVGGTAGTRSPGTGRGLVRACSWARDSSVGAGGIPERRASTEALRRVVVDPPAARGYHALMPRRRAVRLRKRAAIFFVRGVAMTKIAVAILWEAGSFSHAAAL